MSEKLKSCPFCGGIASVIEDNDTSLKNPKKKYAVMCGDCEAITGWNLSYGTAYHYRKTTAIEEWNTRASGWIKTSERLPELHIPVIIYNPEKAEEDEQLTLGRCYKEYKRPVYYWTRARGLPVATEVYPYWMPLPELPEVKG